MLQEVIMYWDALTAAGVYSSIVLTVAMFYLNSYQG